MEARNYSLKTGRNVGAVLGGIAFLAVGLAPSFYFGSMGAVALLASIFGPLEPGIIVRALVVVGTTLGILLGATFCIAGGGAAGWALTLLMEALSSVGKAASPEKEKQPEAGR